jgi:acyl-CoA thioesterase
MSEPGGASGETQARAEQAVAALFAHDRAAHALGIRITAVKAGWAQVSMRVRADMLNGHGGCHGGLIFTLADTAFAFACNSHNERTVASAASIDFLSGAREGDELTAEAHELWRTRRNGIYEITVRRQDGERIALFRGRSHRIDGQLVNPT